MLNLARRVGETVLIGEGIAVTVLGVRGNQVRLGIVAPDAVTILRDEIAARRNPEKAACGEA